MSKDKVYGGKILLFGEYTVLLGGDALAVPLRKLYCYWKQGSEPDQQLLDLVAYLSSESDRSLPWLDLDRLEEESKAGWYLPSTIPTGYGAGSSGSVAAAVYDRYTTDETDDMDLLCARLADLEAFYHGASSGIDPLVSFTDSAVLCRDRHLSCQKLPDDLLHHFFLLDTGIVRSTKPLVRAVKERMEGEPAFESAMAEIKRLQDLAVAALLGSRMSEVFSHAQNISAMQRKWMTELIPGELQDWWAGTLAEGYATPKLCGAGAGGYILIVTRGDAIPQVPQGYSCFPIV